MKSKFVGPSPAHQRSILVLKKPKLKTNNQKKIVLLIFNDCHHHKGSSRNYVNALHEGGAIDFITIYFLERLTSEEEGEGENSDVNALHKFLDDP